MTVILVMAAFAILGWLCSPSEKDNAAAERANRRLFK